MPRLWHLCRYHYKGNRRAPPLVLVADEGYYITSRPRMAWATANGITIGGTHGFDNDLPSMQAILIATGSKSGAQEACCQ